MPTVWICKLQESIFSGGDLYMKKFSIFANILICVSLGLWVIKALLDYNNYTRHIELFATNGWLWYTDALALGNYIIPIIVMCFIVKYIFRKK